MNLRRPATALLATATALGLSGCISADRAPSPETSTSLASPSPEQTYTDPLDEFRQTLRNKPDVNFLFVQHANPVKKAEFTSAENYKDYVANRKALLKSDKTFLANYGKSLLTATYGRITPAKIGVTIVPKGVDTANCTDSVNYGYYEKLESALKRYEKPNALNVIVNDVPSCKDDDHGGFSDRGILPLVNAFGMSYFNKAVNHELGHAAGQVLHAGYAVCRDVITLKDCRVDTEADETSDPTSIMSYVPTKLSNDRFSTVDLYKMGLLDNDEVVINPEPGTVSLAPMSKAGTKLIMATGVDIGEVAYISNEPDPYATVDDNCKDASKLTSKEKKEYQVSGEALVKGKRIILACIYKSIEGAKQFSLRVRTRLKGVSSQGIFVDAVVDPRNFDPLNFSHAPFAGYRRPGTVVLKYDGSSYIDKGQNKAGAELVTVS